MAIPIQCRRSVWVGVVRLHQRQPSHIWMYRLIC